jgi:hypothetical protein
MRAQCTALPPALRSPDSPNMPRDRSDMTEPNEQFVVDPHAARHALILAEAATRSVLELGVNPPVGDLHLALFGPPAADLIGPDPRDAPGVLAFMEDLLIAEHGTPSTAEPIEKIGISKRDIAAVKAFECVHTGLDAYATIVRRAKFDGATRSFGSHRFDQITPGGGSLTLTAAASGWRAEQDYLAAMIVAATLQAVLIEYGQLPGEGIDSHPFLLTDGAWRYPGHA